MVPPPAARAPCSAARQAVNGSPRGRDSRLTDRRAEHRVLDGLVEAVRAGESRVLVVHGELGMGKSGLAVGSGRRVAGAVHGL